MKHPYTTDYIDDFIVGVLPDEDTASFEQQMLGDVELALKVAKRVKHLQEVALAAGDNSLTPDRATPRVSGNSHRQLALLAAAASLLVCLAGVTYWRSVRWSPTQALAVNSPASQAEPIDQLADSWLAMVDEVSLNDDNSQTEVTAEQIVPTFYSLQEIGFSDSLELDGEERSDADDDWLGPLVQQAYLDGDA
ncbi:MAG TPA: hypothetical protein DDW52_15835 [Planctomycetaceae bacterium]|nr:hypothetical protein [Planctomycetaceae bacterium]